ncbi:hypothetical protein PR202_ga10888 [Eleusine coracana subsp. coracana]|uniref:Uncharacterized protein n=1 Tax=Eleusine coracana subsp. coracana TaxID=191504 RepID=A0AAV5C833_ELECO|nr:hypothetical protein PR202_ga10888 [Eleusine coracana subsp. coracana]
MAIRASSWLVLSVLLVLVVAAAAIEEGSPSPAAKDEEGAPSPAADEAADDDGAPAPEPASEEEASIGAKIKEKGKTVLEGLGLSNIKCKLAGNCPAPAPEA